MSYRDHKVGSKAWEDALPNGRRVSVEGGVYAIKGKRGVRFGIVFTVDGEVKYKAVGDTVTAARKRLRKVRVAIDEDTYQQPQKRVVLTFKAFSKIYMRDHSKKDKRSHERDQRTINQILAHKGGFGSKRLDRIGDLDVQGYINHRRQTCSNATVNRDIALVRGILYKAASMGHLPPGTHNPAAGKTNLDEKGRDRRALTTAEEAALMAELPEHLFRIVRFAIETGLRPSEFLALRWENVDIINTRVYVSQSKTKAGKRHVPLNSKALLALPSAQPTGVVFRYKGESIERLGLAFARAARRAGIQECVVSDTGRNQWWPTLYVCRHTFGTRMANSGCHPFALMRLMGHTSIETTNLYYQTSAEHQQEQVDQMQEYVDRMSGATCTSTCTNGFPANEGVA